MHYKFLKNNQARPVRGRLPMATVGSNGGYIALMSVIIICLILIAITSVLSMSNYFSRFNVSDKEYKRVSVGLAESCANAALLKLAQNFSYQPAVGGDIISLGSDSECTISEITGAGTSKVVKTSAFFRNSFSDIEVRATVQDPSLAPIIRSTLSIVTHVLNNDGGIKQASDFTMNVTAINPSQTSFAGAETGVVVLVNAGSYSISGDSMSGYTSSASADCSGSVAAGGNKVCTITYDDISTNATLTVIANVKNDNGGTKTISDFPLFVDGVSRISGQPFTVSVGQHTATNTTIAGYTASSWGYHCASDGKINLTAGADKTCIITYDDNPPPSPSCADTVVMLDRTPSMSSTDLTNERSAAKALLNLYSPLSPRPQASMGYFGLNTYEAEIQSVGLLTDDYGNDSGSSYSVLKFPTNAASPNEWTSPSNAFANDTAFATSSTNSDQQGYSKFGFGVPSGATITGIELAFSGKGSAAVPVDTVNLIPNSVGNYNNWTGNPSNNSSGRVSAVVANNGDGSYISKSSISSTNAQTFIVPDANIPSTATINSVILYAVAAKTNVTDNPIIKLRIEKGTGSSNLSDDPISYNLNSTTYSVFNRSMTINPFTGSAWTAAEVNHWTTRFGVVKTNSSGTAKVTQIYVVVNYTPVPQLGFDLSWNNGSSWSSAKTQNLSIAENTYTLGGSSDKWGSHTWVSGDFSEANFIARVQNNSSTGSTVSLNYITITVYYSLSSTRLYSAIDYITNGTGGNSTNLAKAITVANSELNSTRHIAGKEKVLILISDGDAGTGGTSSSTMREDALDAADSAKINGITIFTIHYGSDPSGFAGKEIMAALSTGSVAIPSTDGHNTHGHQTGSKYDTSNENTDGDNFFIAPSADQMEEVFNLVGKAACPAVATPPPSPPTNGNLVIINYVINDNGGIKQASDFTMNVTAVNPSQNHFAGAGAPGTTITVEPGSYSVDENAIAGYTKTLGVGCSGAITAGETKTCTIINDDIPPAPPAPPPPPPLPNVTIDAWMEIGSWGETP